MWFKNLMPRNRTTSANRACRSFRPKLASLDERCQPSAGVLDPTFGNGAGYVTTSLSNGSDAGREVLVQPSGKLVVAGSTTLPYGTSSYVPAFGVVTYNPDGSLDTAFGSGGIVRQVFQATKTTPASSSGSAAALEPMGATGDNKIVLAGRDPALVGLALMRLNPNGGLDTTFGSGGQVVTSFTSTQSSFEHAASVAVMSSGQIVAVGDDDITWMLARYNPNGSPDATFGSGGKVTTAFNSAGPVFHASVESVAQQPDGKLLVTGNERWNISFGTHTYITYQGIVVRYNANGSLDATFGNGGIVKTVLASGTPDTGNGSRDYGVAVYPNAGTANDGKVVVAGQVKSVSGTGTLTSQALVERYNQNGSLDTTFGNGAGYVTLGNPQIGGLNAVTNASDGKLIVAGTDGFISNGAVTSLVARLNTDGSLDATFGNGGLLPAMNIWPKQVAIQADGKIVAAGNTVISGKSDFAVARFLASEPAIGSFTASPNPVAAGSPVTLTASNITDGNPNSTITQVAFYYFDSSGTKVILGYGAQTSPGVWTFTFTVNLAPGTYTLFTQAEDSYGVVGDPLALTLQVL